MQIWEQKSLDQYFIPQGFFAIFLGFFLFLKQIKASKNLHHLAMELHFSGDFCKFNYPCWRQKTTTRYSSFVRAIANLANFASGCGCIMLTQKFLALLYQD